MTRFAIKCLKLPLLPIAGLCAIAVRLLYRVGVHIQFGGFVSSRIGHLCGNTNVYLCEREEGRRDSIHIWTQYGPVASKQMAKMVNRAVSKTAIVDPTGFAILVVLMNKLFDGWERFDVGFTTWDRDPDGLLQKYPPHLYFTDAEEARGRHEVASLGIPLDAKWVCLMVRDGAYLPSLPYHNYRNADIDTYADAALHLAKRGYYVVRIGEKMEKPFSAKHPRIIDYAFHEQKNDFTSIYLAARCHFAISSGLGIDSVTEAFRRPVCYTNYVPLAYLRTYHPNSLTIWKHHEKDGKRMSVEEIHESGAATYMESATFEANNVKLIDNTPQELLDVVEEMADMMEGRFRPDAQEAFWKAWPMTECPFHHYNLHGVLNTRIGSKFLRGYDAERKEDTGGDTGAGRIEAGADEERNDLQDKRRVQIVG